MLALRLFLIIGWTVLLAYTSFTVGKEGINLFPAFFGAMASGSWQGQFNLDFMLMLMLSALWTGWRNGWSVSGSLLAIVAFFGGAAFLKVYLLVLLHREQGDMRRVLLGVRASA